MIKSIWKFLTEDPSKPVANPIEPIEEVKSEPEIKPEPEVPTITLYDKIIDFKNQSNRGTLSPSSCMSDIQILHLNKSYDYDYGYRDMYNDGYSDYSNYKRERSSSSDKYEVIIKLSGRLLFQDAYPMIVSGELRPAIEHSSVGIMKLGNEDIDSSLVKDITLSLEISENSRKLGTDDIQMIINVNKLSVRRTLSDQSGIKTKSKDYYQLDIPSRIRCGGYGHIMGLLNQMLPDVKNSIEKNFKDELVETRKQIKINNTLREFDDKINENSVRDCFAYAMDELGVDSCSVELMGVVDKSNSAIKDMSGKYWQVFIDLKTNRRSSIGDTQISIDDKSLNILFEINEGINRIKQIYDNCEIKLNICDTGGFQIEVRPIIERGVEAVTESVNPFNDNADSLYHRMRSYQSQSRAEREMVLAEQRARRYDRNRERYNNDDWYL